MMKCRIALANFTGKSTLSAYRDFHATVFAKNPGWKMAFSVRNRLDRNTDVKKYRYPINFAQAFSKSKGMMALLFQDTSRRIRRLIADLQDSFPRTVAPLRPGRKYPRKHKAKPRKFFVQYKPIG